VYKEGTKVMVFMQQQMTSKERKLALPYYGTHHVLEIWSNSLWYDLRINEPVMVSMDHLVTCSEESSCVWKEETPHKTSGMWRESLSWILHKKLHNCVDFRC